MTLLVLAIALGFLARRLTATDSPLPVLAWPAIPLLAVGLQVLNQVGGLGSSALTGATHLLVTMWALALVRQQPSAATLGVAVVAVGFVLNLAPVLANGRMPVTEAAARTVGFEIDDQIETGNLAKHRIARDGDQFMFLADTIAVPPLKAVVSPGDLIMAAGTIMAICPLWTTRRGTSVASRAPGGHCIPQ